MATNVQKKLFEKHILKLAQHLKEAVANGYIVHNPTCKITIRGAKGTKDSEKYLDEEESKLLLDELMDRIVLNYATRYMLITVSYRHANFRSNGVSV
jgi:hypothetical protein